MFNISASSIKRTLFSIVVFASLGGVAIPASASVEQIVENGILMGANNVDVNGTLFDVRFVDGLYDTVFPIQPYWVTNNLQNYYDIELSLTDSVFVDSSAGAFDSRPELTNGCSWHEYCQILTPIYEYVDNGIQRFNSTGVVNFIGESDSEYPVIGDRSVDYSNIYIYDYIVWAVWTPSVVAAVPEPSTYAMLGLGLLGIMRMRRRQQQV